MMKLMFLVPDADIQSGGHLAQIRFYDLCKNFTEAEIITYRTPDERYRNLDDIFTSDNTLSSCIFVIHWGPHVTDLAKRLRSRSLKVVYFAHSTGWDLELDDGVPIVCVSKNTQAIRGRLNPRNPIFTVPNVLDSEFYADDTEKDIDVFIQKRKSSDYLINTLAPELSKYCNVVVLDEWVESLSPYFRRSKVYLYDSVGHWVRMKTTEGFGLPPLEALACGCIVYSSINDALSDYLDPGFNSGQVGVYSVAYDVKQILNSLETGTPIPSDYSFLDIYRERSVEVRLNEVFKKIEDFFSLTDGSEADVPHIDLMTEEHSLLGRLIRIIVPNAVKSKIKKILKEYKGN